MRGLPCSGDVPRAKSLAKSFMKSRAESFAASRSQGLDVFVYVYNSAFHLHIIS